MMFALITYCFQSEIAQLSYFRVNCQNMCVITIISYIIKMDKFPSPMYFVVNGGKVTFENKNVIMMTIKNLH